MNAAFVAIEAVFGALARSLEGATRQPISGKAF
jgi:hypothetical protein